MCVSEIDEIILRLPFAVWVVLFFVMVCFVANNVITRYLVLQSNVSPFLLTVIRFASGFGTLLIIPALKPTTFRRDKLRVSYILGAFFLGFYAFSISYGYSFIPVAAGTFVYFTFVAVTMVIYSVIMDHVGLTLRLAIGLLVGLFGVLVITFGRIGSVTLTGVLLMAATGIAWGLYSCYGRRFGNAFGYTFNSFLLLGAGAVLASIVLWLSAVHIFSNISVQDLGLALYMGMISTALSYVAWNETVKKIPTSLGGLVQLLVPVLAPVVGIVFLGEQVNASLVIGGSLVMAGIYLAQSKTSSKG